MYKFTNGGAAQIEDTFFEPPLNINIDEAAEIISIADIQLIYKIDGNGASLTQ